MDKLHTVDAAKAYLGCSDELIYRLIDSGELRAINIAHGSRKRCLRIPDTSLQDFLQRRTIDQRPAKSQRRKPAAKPKRNWV